MKKLILLGCFLWVSNLFAQGESRFHFLTSKCEPETKEGVEATPQSPPLYTDDPSTPGCNAWEANITFDGDLSKGENNWELPLLDLNYGVGDNFQLKYEIPYLMRQEDARNTSAIGNSKAGIKYQFYDDEENQTEISVYPQVEFVTPSSKATEEGLTSSGSIATFPLLFAKKIGHMPNGDIRLTANLGYNISSQTDTSSFVSASAGVGFPVLKYLSIMGEFFTLQAVSNDSDGIRNQVVVSNVGFIGLITKSLMIYGSVGRSIHTSDPEDHTYVLGGIRVLAGGA